MKKIQPPHILLTAFRGSSAELLTVSTLNYSTILLPNDKIKDTEKLVYAIMNEQPDYVISFGQKPNIKNKIHIEITAKEGDSLINTNFDYTRLQCLFSQSGIITKISHNAGTSFCNQLYLNVLRYIYKNNIDTKMIFVHIPFVKNITNFTEFSNQILNAISNI